MSLRISKITLTSLTVVLLAVGFLPSLSQAVTCTVIVANQPDPNITGAISTDNNSNGFQTTDGCGMGDSSNTTAGQISLLNSLFSTTVTLIDKSDDAISGAVPGALDVVANGAPSGTWSVDLASLNTYDKLFLVMKDGGTGDGSGPDQVNWVWYILDETLNATCISPADICGNWSMWGNSPSDTTPSNLSHMTLYGSVGTGPGPGPGPSQEVPEPSTFILLGSGLLLVRRATRGFGRLSK
jgi:hypothetical protein